MMADKKQEMNEMIPPKITADQYDKLLRRIWEMEQRLAVAEKSSSYAVDKDMLFDELRKCTEKLELCRKAYKNGERLVIALVKLFAENDRKSV